MRFKVTDFGISGSVLTGGAVAGYSLISVTLQAPTKEPDVHLDYFKLLHLLFFLLVQCVSLHGCDIMNMQQLLYF